MKMAAEELARADEERLQAWDLLEEVVFLFTEWRWPSHCASILDHFTFTGYDNGLPNVYVYLTDH